MGTDHTRLRHDPERTLRRIAKLEAVRRRVARSLGRCTPGSDYARELARQTAEMDDQLALWRGVIAEAVAAGFKIWSAADFSRGDFVEYDGTLFEVLRVNTRSLTVRHTPAGDGERRWTVRYTDGITGRRSAEEMSVHERGEASD